jgi:hypothetical protein
MIINKLLKILPLKQKKVGKGIIKPAKYDEIQVRYLEIKEEP